MHEIKIDRKKLDTDLILEKKIKLKDSVITNYKQIKVVNNKFKDNRYSTIYFNDITDKDNYLKVQEIFIKELKKLLNPAREDKVLVVGLGNSKSTPDSLGPYTVENVLVTRYLFLLGDVESGYSNVCSFSPGVVGNTGIETSDIIKSVIKDTKVNKVIVVDALKTNDIDRLVKTIQITDSGIFPGSGIGNNRKEISKKTMKIDVIAIGVPTVMDIKGISKDSFIVTPTSIDFMIEKLASLIGNGINISLHKNFIRHNN